MFEHVTNFCNPEQMDLLSRNSFSVLTTHFVLYVLMTTSCDKRKELTTDKNFDHVDHIVYMLILKPIDITFTCQFSHMVHINSSSISVEGADLILRWYATSK